MRDPLNPTLYGLLSQRYGEVEVVAEGQAISWSLELSEWSRRQRISDTQTKKRYSRVVLASGEEYRLRCPFCKDHRPRLYINHRWGVWDEETESYNLFLAQCFNENCLAERDNQEALYRRLFLLPKGQWDRTLRVKVGAKTEPRKLQELPPPGPMVCLDTLMRDNPSHHAVQYLLSRGLDPDYLGSRFGVSYCRESRYDLASDRIIIPIHMNGLMVGWQARYIGDDHFGESLNKAKIPKYWTSPGMPRKLTAYNFDTAVRHRMIVLVEGPVDVWKGGPCYMGLIGKTMSTQLIGKLASVMRRRHGEQASVFVMLDPEQDEKDKQRGKPHHIERVYHSLLPLFPGRVGKVYLEEGFDPGKLDRRFLRSQVRKAGQEQGVPVYFGRPSE